MINNQLGRRNLSKETMSYLRGFQFEREKKKREFNGNQYNKEVNRQNDGSATAERLATQHNVSPRTIERDADYSKAVDTIVKNTSPKVKQKILNENIISIRGFVNEKLILQRLDDVISL